MTIPIDQPSQREADAIAEEAHQLRRDRDAADSLCQQIAMAQAALTEAHSLLRAVSVGDDEGRLDYQDHTDAVHELIVARRALRHLSRITEAHADILDDLAGQS